MITFTNINNGPIKVDDLGLYLENQESIDLEELFIPDEILSSEDVEPLLTNNAATAEIDGSPAQWSDIVAYFKKLTELEHEALDTLTHELSENLFFESIKDVNGQTQSIVYYTDSTRLLKVREEEILRDSVGRAQTIIVKQYNLSGNIVKQDIQTINRSPEGTFDNIVQIKG